MGRAAGDMNRRAFLSKTATVIAGSAAFGSTALSYARIIGANDRISLGHIGIGSRGNDLVEIAGRLKISHNVDMTAVCDLWSVNRDKARTVNAKYYGREPRALQHVEELLALKDVDAVLISTPEHSHSARSILSALTDVRGPVIATAGFTPALSEGEAHRACLHGQLRDCTPPG